MSDINNTINKVTNSKTKIVKNKQTASKLQHESEKLFLGITLLKIFVALVYAISMLEQQIGLTKVILAQ